MNNQSFDPNAYGNQPTGDQNQAKNEQTAGQNTEQQSYNGQPYGNPYGQPYAPYQPLVQPAHKLAMASLICGIISFFCFGLPLSIAALVCSIKAKKEGNTENINTIGLIIAIVSIVLNAISVISMIAIMPTYIQMLEELLEQSMFIFRF
ncbi:MAG: DUF4190 domain-containing protein [Clostridia bacterium]|nr:DUF4190 domain-containing protein [Clostridia bacterium]